MNSNYLDFGIIGAQKASSSSLHLYLSEHPEVGCEFDEKVFFEDPYYSVERVAREVRLLKEKMPDKSIYGFKRPDLFTDPKAPERLIRQNPNMKIVVVLREPGDRAVSAYAHFLRSCHLPWPESFDSGLKSVFSNPNSTLSFTEKEIRVKGLYGQAYERWLGLFGAQKIWIGTRRMMTDSNGEYGAIEEFLGISNKNIDVNWKKSKAGCYNLIRLRFLRLASTLALSLRKESEFYNFRRPRAISRLAMRIFTEVDNTILRKIFKKRDLTISSSTKVVIQDFYKDDLKKLKELTGIDIKTWKNSNGLDL